MIKDFSSCFLQTSTDIEKATSNVELPTLTLLIVKGAAAVVERQILSSAPTKKAPLP